MALLQASSRNASKPYWSSTWIQHSEELSVPHVENCDSVPGGYAPRRGRDAQQLHGVVITTESVVQIPREGAVAEKRLEPREELLHGVSARQRVSARVMDDKIEA